MKRVWLGVLATAVAGTASAQQAVLNPKLAEAQQPKFMVPFCNLKPDGKVKKGMEAFRKSYDKPEEKAAKLTEAKALIMQGLAEDQANSAAGWYYLARVYLMQGDVGGVDSAFKKALALEPSCEIDINQYRQNSWAALANAGLEAQRAGDTEGAVNLFRDADRLFDVMPHVAANLGVLFANTGKNDSAAVYFARAMMIAEKGAQTDTSMAADRNSAAFNLALIYQRLGRHKDAIPVLRKYLQWDPKSIEGKKALTTAFREAGMPDSAAAVQASMLSEMSQKNLDSLDMADVLALGVAAFHSEEYERAVEAFSKVVAKSPYNRDALYNLANAHLALKQHEKVVEVGLKLVEIEPMNEDIYRLVAQAQRELKQEEALLRTAEKLVALPVTIDITSFALGREGVQLGAKATGREPTDAASKPIPPAPVKLVFEFLDASGTVVDKQEVTVPVVAKAATHDIKVSAKGKGIAAWRYKRV